MESQGGYLRRAQEMYSIQNGCDKRVAVLDFRAVISKEVMIDSSKPSRDNGQAD